MERTSLGTLVINSNANRKHRTDVIEKMSIRMSINKQTNRCQNKNTTKKSFLPLDLFWYVDLNLNLS